MRKFLQRADDVLWFENEPIPQLQVDGVESCWLVGHKLHITYFQNQQAWVDGILQMRRRPIVVLVATLAACAQARRVVGAVLQAAPGLEETTGWLGTLIN